MREDILNVYTKRISIVCFLSQNIVAILTVSRGMENYQANDLHIVDLFS